MRSVSRDCLVLVLLGSVFACRSDRQESPPEPRQEAAKPAPREASDSSNVVRIDAEMLRDLRITTTAVEVRPGGEGVTVLGELRVNENTYAEMGSPIQARVVRILASLGDSVRPGQPLLELQSVELGKARAAYLSATARAELAERTLQRRRELAGERIVPQREVQEAEAEAASADAEVRAARAGLEALGVSGADLGAGASGDAPRFLLRAPIRGTVIERDVAQGQMIDAGNTAFRIANISTLWLIVHAFERDAIRLKVGSTARVALPALPGQPFLGKVSLVGRQVDPESRTIAVRIELANPGGLLRPGMSATAWVPLKEAGGPIITVPAASLQRVREAWCVFLPRDKSTFEIRPVGRGRELGGEIEVLSGLRPGETIVVDGAFLLKAEAEKAHVGGDHERH